MNVIVQSKLIKLHTKLLNKAGSNEEKDPKLPVQKRSRAELLLTWLFSECVCWFETTHPTDKKFCKTCALT